MRRSSPTIKLWIGWIAMLTLGFPSAAQFAGDDGIPVGPWFLKPYLSLDYEADNNIFRRSDESAAGTQSDRIQRIFGRVNAALPFRKSELRFFGEGSIFSYKNQPSLERESSHKLGVELDLLFSSGDRLRFSDRTTRGFSEVQEFAGDEIVFQGQPYRAHDVSLTYDRNVRNRRGWLLNVSRRDFIFENETAVSYFDYRGYSGTAEYREPLNPKLWIIAGVSTRQYDHFETNDTATVGIPFRTEDYKNYVLGLRGELGEDQPFLVQVGYGTLNYGIVEAEEFEDFVGRVNWTLRLGPRASLSLGARRQALPSFLGSFYQTDEVSAQWNQVLTNSIQFGASVRYAMSEYGCTDETTSVCRVGLQGRILDRREDDLYLAGVSLIYAPHPRIGLRLSGSYQERDSSSRAFSFDNTVVTVSIITGWFNP